MLIRFLHLHSPRSLSYKQLRSNVHLYALRLHSTAIAMDKVYLRNAQDTTELHITFRYANEALRVDRSFNFCRRMDERVEEALVRIRNNIEKELTRRTKKKSKVETATPPNPGEIVVELQRGGSEERISDLTFAEVLADQAAGLQLRVMDSIYEVLLNQPWTGALQLPGSIMAGFRCYPLKLELEFASRAHSSGQWFRAALPASGVFNAKTVWTPCGEGLIYEVTQADVDHYLKLVVTPGNASGLAGPATECISKSAVQRGPGACPFELRQQHTTQPLSSAQQLRVVSYNLLADLYADGDYARKQLFPFCAPAALKIEYRKQLFIKELLGYNADLLCLQEVDLKIFEHDLKPVLASAFDGIMTPKGACAEGIALFYRTSRFRLLNNYVLHLGYNISTLPIFAPLWSKIKVNEQLAKRICERSTTLQLSLLELKDTGRYVLVANTHLYFHPDADHIRLLQIGFSMLFVEHIYKQVMREHHIEPRNLGLIFCGDFNSVPECGIYKLMTQRFVDRDFMDWRSNAEEAVKEVELRQSFNMESACGTPPFTNYTTLFAACLDYIFYQSDCFDLLQSVPLPTVEELSANEAIPSVVFPSDHVALVADLAFKST